jgi:hypothetical protein
MTPIQPLVRLPHSHIDPNWLSTVECASRTPPREFYEWVADHILSVTGSLQGSRHVVRKSSADEMRVCRYRSGETVNFLQADFWGVQALFRRSLNTSPSHLDA